MPGRRKGISLLSLGDLTEFFRLIQVFERGVDRLSFHTQLTQPLAKISSLFFETLTEIPLGPNALLQISNGLLQSVNGHIGLLQLVLTGLRRVLHLLHF